MIDADPQSQNPFIHTLKRLAANPFGESQTAKALVGVQHRELQGRLHRAYVGGNTGRRLFYITNSEERVVLPFFLSDIKARLDYDKVGWEEMGRKVWEDYTAGRLERFVRLKTLKT